VGTVVVSSCLHYSKTKYGEFIEQGSVTLLAPCPTVRRSRVGLYFKILLQRSPRTITGELFQDDLLEILAGHLLLPLYRILRLVVQGL
jgi:hypothetical protein